jgi:predicted ATP-grasp superfamily ATP-dependent carboligase
MARTPPGALIVGGAHVSIAVARSLGRRGIPVWLLANHPLPKFSRYVERSFDWPGADHEDGLAAILDLAEKHDLSGWVLIATGDQDMRMIAQNRTRLSQYFHVATPDWDTIQWVYDKRLTQQRARALGIDVPLSFEVNGLEELSRLECRFPVILKPAFRNGADAFTLAKAWKADDRDALLSLYRRAAALIGGEAVMVQEWIPGSGTAQFSCAGLWERGTPIATLTARRSRQYPVDFGRSSTFVETIVQSEVQELACRFMRSLAYTGVAELEFKYDAREKRFKLLDVNGRFWTWCGLGPLAGIDFAYLAWRQARGETVTAGRARPGVAWVHGRGDVKAAYREWRAGTLTLRDYLAGFRQPMALATFALDDPMPAIMEFPAALLNRFAPRVLADDPQRETAKLRTAK